MQLNETVPAEIDPAEAAAQVENSDADGGAEEGGEGEEEASAE